MSEYEKHPDDEDVLVGYSSSRNITFKDSGEELGVTWGEWRAMTEKQQASALTDFLWSIVDVYVEGDER